MKYFVLFILFVTVTSAARAECPLASTAVCNGTSCANEVRPIGTIVYNTDYEVLQVCNNNGDWQAISVVNDPCEGNPDPGDQCEDGTYYIGDSPEDGARVYMTSQAYETASRWDSASCYLCGDGSTATSETDGRANTEALLTFNPTGFDAAIYCDGLEAHGYSDWYLPAGGFGTGTEQNLFWAMVQAEGPVDGIGASSSWYRSSSDFTSSHAKVQRFDNGFQPDPSYGKQIAHYLVRCVRR